MRILHLGYDNMFIARFSELLEEVAPGRSRYVVLAQSGELAHPLAAETAVARTLAEARERVLEAAPECDALMVHYMFPWCARIAEEVPDRLTLLWSGFGGDYCGTAHDPYAGLLGPSTAELQRRVAPRLRPHARALRAWKRAGYETSLRRVAARSRFFSAPVRTDLEVFFARFPQFSGEFLQLNYGTAEELAPARSAPTGEHVLVGNSATLTNNHLDVFERLRQLRPDGRKVIVPLTYGEPAAYREVVLTAGRRLFGDDFTPIVEHLPIDDYQELLSTCRFVLMGHRRQQGLGNILTAMLGGSAVLLDPVNPVFAELTRAGAHVGVLDGAAGASLEEYGLDEAQRAQNREVVQRLWGRQRVLENLRVAVQTLSGTRAQPSSR